MVKKEKIENKIITKDENSETKKNVFSKDGELVVDIYETSSEFVILSAIAGVVIEDIDISVDKELLIVRGERKNPSKEPGKKYYFQECWWGPFSKKIVLPNKVKVEDASAEIDKGILTIRIPKIEEVKSKDKIDIKVA
jgi:HSP20 family protein